MKVNTYLAHVLAIIGFIIVAVLYFKPVLENKVLYQSDIALYMGMAKEQNDYRETHQQEPYWTNAAFGGMPTYQLGAKYPHNYIKELDLTLRFLPRPADYVFLYFLGFYVLLSVLKIDPLKAFFGALAFGFSTYLIIIFGAGHNAKAHAIAYMPLVIAGVILVFRKNYIIGGLLTMIAAGLEIQANHFQMTYYLLFILICITVYYLYEYIKNKDYKSLAIISGVFALSGVLALGMNATNLLATSEYAKFSTRGKNDLTLDVNGNPLNQSTAMSNEYITEYSYGMMESLNFIVPRLFGGGSSEKLGEGSNLYNLALNIGASPYEALDFASKVPLYWGDQPIVAAPAYVGIVVFFLAILGFIIVKRKIKYAFLAAAIVSLFLSWGHNFSLLTDMMIKFFPLYDKFRAVTSILVILELCIPVVAMMACYEFFKQPNVDFKKPLLYAAGSVGGILVLLLIAKGSFTFSSPNDSYYLQAYGELGPVFVEALEKDRMTVYTQDIIRSLGFLVMVTGILFAYMYSKLSSTIAFVMVGVLMVGDLIGVNRRYINESNFVNKIEMEMPFAKTEADAEILKDTSHFRVFEPSALMNSRTSYFHKSIGGYSAVKPQRIQHLYDYHLANQNFDILNMLNVKYIIQTGQDGKSMYQLNPEANGNAWFVQEVHLVNNADEEISALNDIDTKKSAIVNKNEFDLKYTSKVIKDSLASIELVSYSPNKMTYKSNNSNNGVAVFSEIYYPKGWKVSVDGADVEMFRTNYVLRGLEIPAGNHTIEFYFDPEVVKKGSMISLWSSIVILIVFVLGIGSLLYKRRSLRNE